MTRTDRERVADALVHIAALKQHLERGDLDDSTIAAAISLRLAAAIEALRTLDGLLEESLFGKEWPAIWATRNRIAHGYAYIDLRRIKATIEQDLPGFESRLHEWMNRHSGL